MMASLAGVAPTLIHRARTDQVATIYASWMRTTLSMLLGAALLGVAMWSVVPPALLAGWFALVVLNQLGRWRLTLAWRRARPGPGATDRWGRYWAIGSSASGALWGIAAVTMFPASAAHQALLIVCLFGVVLGGLNLTAVWRPSFYGFVLPALVPLILRVAWEGDAVHLYIALVLSVVLAFVLAFGHRVNDVLTQALAMRYENVDLIAELKGQTRAAVEARAAAEAANRAKSQLLAAASHDLRQPLHAAGLFVAALAARSIDPDARVAGGARPAGARDARGAVRPADRPLEARSGHARRGPGPRPARAAVRADRGGVRAAGRGEGIAAGRRAYASRRRQRRRRCFPASCATSSPTPCATRAPAVP